MVAKTPPKLKKKIVAPLDPNQLRETVNKVEKCMARLQELQYLTGGTKVVAGVNLSPRSTRGYLKTSLRCKQEYLRIRNANGRKSPPGKLPVNTGEWRRMSLPAMLLGETVGEILQASQFAREIVAAVEGKAKPKSKKISTTGDPRTPVAVSRENSRLSPETTELRARRHREKQITLHKTRAECLSPSLQRAKSRINFKVSGSSPQRREIEKAKEVEKENCRYLANRVSPKHRPWAKKTVLFPNPLFHSSPTSQNQKFCRTKSPVIPRNRQQTPHKFLIKTPPVAAGKAVASSSVAKFQVKIRSPPLSLSPTRPTTNTTSLSRKKSMSPPKKMSTTAAKLRRSFSPSRLVGRLVSPLKSRKSSVQRSSIDGGGGGGMMMNMMSGLKQRPSSTAITTTPMNLSARRI